MLRRLVTLLAFLSGLAAIGAPVQARAAELPGVGMVASAEMRADCVRTEARLAERRPTAEESTLSEPCRKPAPSVAYFPPGRIKADRARE